MNEQQDDLGPGCYCPPANVGDGIKPQSECPVHAYLTTEQQGSDESGEGLREAIRAGLRKCRVEDGSPVSLIREDDLSHITHMVTIELVPFMAALATARRDADELRGRLAAVEALLDQADDDARQHRHLARLSTHQIRAALANPSAAQGEGEVGK